MLLLAILLLLLSPVTKRCDCTNVEDDWYTITAILEDTLMKDCVSLRKLAGVFFSDQQRQPRTVRVKYELEIPLNEKCSSEYIDCWSLPQAQCNISNGKCSITREYLWGRTPSLVHDHIYRNLELCPFVVGGLKEKYAELKLDLFNNYTSDSEGEIGLDCVNERDFPCGWCKKRPKVPISYKSKNILDTAYSASIIDNSPLDLALTTVTAKLQGYAVKAQQIPWLVYSSHLAVGYASKYGYQGSLHGIRYATLILSNFFLHVVIFMLLYKFRKRLYRKVLTCINGKNETNAKFWSFIMTSFIAFPAICYMSMYDNSLCITLLEIIFLSQSLIFVLPNFAIIYYTKLSSKFYLPTRCGRYCCVNYSVQIILLFYILTWPHVLVPLVIFLSTNFFQNPLSYIILILYFTLSLAVLWVVNALAIHLVTSQKGSSNKVSCIKKKNCRRWTFTVSLFLACNLLNFTAWSFVSVSFYDTRSNATSYLTLIPGLILSIVGWYLSGNLTKLFNLFTKKEKEQSSYVRVHNEVGSDRFQNRSWSQSMHELLIRRQPVNDEAV